MRPWLIALEFGPADVFALASLANVEFVRVNKLVSIMWLWPCGEVESWPLMGWLTVIETANRYGQFGNAFRDARDDSDFGPFLFERSAYEIEIARLLREAVAWTVRQWRAQEIAKHIWRKRRIVIPYDSDND